MKKSKLTMEQLLEAHKHVCEELDNGQIEQDENVVYQGSREEALNELEKMKSAIREDD